MISRAEGSDRGEKDNLHPFVLEQFSTGRAAESADNAVGGIIGHQDLSPGAIEGRVGDAASVKTADGCDVEIVGILQ